MEAVTLPVFNTQGKEVDTIKLSPFIFDGTVNSDCVHQAVVNFRANQRKGLASTKTRGEVSGGGKKPWKQKGTGRARVGSIRSPLWRHGGVVFGPHPRDFSFRIPVKIKKLALKSTLNSKAKENNLMVLDEFSLQTPKTKSVCKIFSDLKLASNRGKKETSILLLLEKIDANILMALNNISFLSVGLAKETHAYEVMSHKKLVITKEGLNCLVKRFKK